MKVVYNACFGGYSLSQDAVELLRSRYGLEGDANTLRQYLPRHDERLVAVVEELGSGANGLCANLQIAHIIGNRYRIAEYDGSEDVQEPDDIDWVVV